MNKYILIDRKFTPHSIYNPCMNYYVVRDGEDGCFYIGRMYAFHSELLRIPYPHSRKYTKWATADEIFKDYI